MCYNNRVDSVKIAAKVNLSLAITGKRGHLHTLDMRVCSVNLFDRVTLIAAERAAEKERAGECVVLGDGKFAFASSLAAFRPKLMLPRMENAYAATREFFGDADGVLLVERNIPPCAGMGGSSAAVVGMVRLMSARTGKTPTTEFLLSLGSDVPYMYVGGEARVTGCGESVERLPFVERHIVVVYPEGGVDTASAYSLYDAGARCRGDNHLFAAACALNGNVPAAERALREAGAEKTVMSGSGSAVCAFFDDEREAAYVMSALPPEFNAELLRTIDGFPYSARSDL